MVDLQIFVALFLCLAGLLARPLLRLARN